MATVSQTPATRTHRVYGMNARQAAAEEAAQRTGLSSEMGCCSQGLELKMPLVLEQAKECGFLARYKPMKNLSRKMAK